MIKNYLMKYSWAMWVGIGLGALYDSSFDDWRFWVFLFVIAPLVILRDYPIINEFKKEE